MTDEHYMKMALALARRGAPWACPNPLVGAVIVKDGRIIGKGYHRCCGENHAEINAIESATEPIRGSTVYVTLEPCSHHGKTPPCADRLVQEKPARVVIGTIDPNPVVSGRGIAMLKRHGIETRTGVLEEACRELNEVFFKFIRTRIPFVTLKFAQSLDGKIATATGHSRWISSEPSRVYAHRLRSLHDAILVGSGTIVKDDPELTCRLVKGRDPLRVVVDSTLRIGPGARVLQDQQRAQTLIFTTSAHDRKKRSLLADRGIEVRVAGRKRVDLAAVLEELGRREISSLLVEGGAGVLTSFIREGLADRLIVISAPKIFGKGTDAIGDLGVRTVDQAVPIVIRRVSHRHGDIIVDARFIHETHTKPK
ncbi:MAG: bifunctional diaminohydroxyphosphoribosylaminopyrimidine deaminase/5-amino-6-(5-phosphoribosylamino)uracil reductase RibD [Syntrophaceae bacterium]|nr:bifunctional diaminohydroxyphosphoribosylaminopyrimidine deaminase/5-amino-6-(5-phosphoribosylamino)uracil reductase RibD [Syntrophaceae bacterium]